MPTPRLSDSRLATVVSRVRPGLGPAIRISILAAAVISIALWIWVSPIAGAIAIAPVFPLTGIRFTLMRRELRQFSTIESEIDAGALDEAADRIGELLSRGPTSGANLRAALFASLAEVAWRRGLDDDAIALSEYVVSEFPRSRVGRFSVSMLSALIHAMRGEYEASERALAITPSISGLRPSLQGQLHLEIARLVLAFNRGQQVLARDIAKSCQKHFDKLDEHRRAIAIEIQTKVTTALSVDKSKQ